MNRPRIYLAALGDVNDPGTWSGIPYHFLQAAQAGNLIDEGITLLPEGAAYRRRRLIWNAWRFLCGKGKGGFQYSVTALERLWMPVRESVIDHLVINCFQLFPPSVVDERRIRKMFYIDMTLTQLFDFYQERSTVGASIANEAVRREKQGYQAAELVVCHSQWAAQNVIAKYEIEPEKVKVIVPGANIDLAVYHQWQQHATIPTRPQGKPLHLMFIGKQWHRKGLDRLLEALQIVEKQGRRIDLTVLGCHQHELPIGLQDVANVHWLGFLDKRKEMSRFLKLVAEADVGCLLSRAEAGGMVLREYHALGLVVLGTAVGGSPEHMFPDAGYAMAPDATSDEIARWLLELLDHPEKLEALRQRAWERKAEATWDATVTQWRELLT